MSLMRLWAILNDIALVPAAFGLIWCMYLTLTEEEL
jgi:hypothetical protein